MQPEFCKEEDQAALEALQTESRGSANFLIVYWVPFLVDLWVFTILEDLKNLVDLHIDSDNKKIDIDKKTELNDWRPEIIFCCKNNICIRAFFFMTLGC